MEPVVSVIVPVYNAQDYLFRCLGSILNQSLSNIEIIAVNDGSIDGSLALLLDLGKQDSRLRVVTQKNAGPSAARNLGLNHVKGKYISFVDADDTIEPDMLRDLVNEAEKSRADIVMCGYSYITHDKVVLTYIPDKCWGDFLDQKGINERVIPKIPTYQFNAIFNKLYRTSLIQDRNIRFPEMVQMGEDLLFNIDVIEAARNIAFVKNCLYNYYQTAGSLTHRYIEKITDSKKRIRDRITLLANNRNVQCPEFQKNMDTLTCLDIAESAFNLLYQDSPLTWRFLSEQLKLIATANEQQTINFEGIRRYGKMAQITVRLLKSRQVFMLGIILLLYRKRFLNKKLSEVKPCKLNEMKGATK